MYGHGGLTSRLPLEGLLLTTHTQRAPSRRLERGSVRHSATKDRFTTPVDAVLSLSLQTRLLW